MRGKVLRAIGVATGVVCAGLVGLLFISANATRQPKMVTGEEDHAVYYRLKADYTYKSASGNIPWTFDIVIGCGVHLTQYITGDVADVSQRVPTLYALPTPDGHALMIEAPKACGGQTTANGRVPQDFFPAVVYYEHADNLSLGMLYLSEDAYDGPLSKLNFHGATISEATKEEFAEFMASGWSNNLISYESSKEIKAPPPFTLADELKNDPGAYWKTHMPTNCWGAIRLKMPEGLRAFVRPLWEKDGPRYWTVSSEKARQILTMLGQVTKDSAWLFNRYPFQTYRLYPTPETDKWATGLINRRGGGTFGVSQKIVQWLPADYFPLTMSEALPWLKLIDPKATALTHNIEIDNAEKKGFFYCYDSQGPIELMNHFLSDFHAKLPKFPTNRTIDGTSILNGETGNLTASDGLIFDRDEYMIWVDRVLL